MLFCGQCGLQLAPGSAACPRCGSVTQPALPPIDNPHADEPTIQSDPRLPLQPPQTPLPQTPGYSPLSPTPGNNDPYATEQIPDTPRPPDRASHPGFSGYSNNPIFQDYPAYQSNPSPAASNYAAQRVQESRLQQPGNVYNPSSTPGLTEWAGNNANVPPPQEPPQKRRGYGALAALLFVLLIIACIVILFLVKPAGLFGNPNTTPTPSTTTASPTVTSGPSAVQQAQTTVQTYYTDINNRDYQSAYNLWISYNQTESQFASGFTNTIHDTITITNATQQPDGTVKVSVTLVAQNTTGTTTYNGYYIVQQQNNSWMLLNGHLA